VCRQYVTVEIKFEKVVGADLLQAEAGPFQPEAPGGRRASRQVAIDGVVVPLARQNAAGRGELIAQQMIGFCAGCRVVCLLAQ
jgi:hypothetical protein